MENMLMTFSIRIFGTRTDMCFVMNNIKRKDNETKE